MFSFEEAQTMDKTLMESDRNDLAEASIINLSQVDRLVFHTNDILKYTSWDTQVLLRNAKNDSSYGGSEGQGFKGNENKRAWGKESIT